MTAAGWEFLKRKNWARLSLSALNALFLFGMLWAAIYYFAWVHSFTAMITPEIVAQAGTTDPSMFLWLGGALGFLLMIAPLVWMAWYFHSDNVRGCFE
jgi:hypothetical protein